MKTKIVKIGNSRGIRIPKSLLDESGIKNEIDLEVGNGQITIKSISKIRESWDSAFQKMPMAMVNFLNALKFIM